VRWAKKQGPPITLSAALRDAGLAETRARDLAIRHLADALLVELGDGARWRIAEQHARGPEVLAALRRALAADPSPVIQGFAGIGLGQLGDPEALVPLRNMLADETDEHEGAVFRRECGAIGLAQLGAAARAAAEGEAVLQAICHALEHALGSRRPELRFQAAQSLVEVVGDAAEGALLGALEIELHPEVRRGLCEALTSVARPGAATVARLEALLATPGLERATAFAAALVLTAAGAASGGQALLAAVAEPERRDRALEALAVLGEAAPAEARAPLHRMATSWLTPGPTKVRAAYALARIWPEKGSPILEELGRSRRPSVREAVEDARAALAGLAAKNERPEG